jgi:uncharacterized membrane protein
LRFIIPIVILIALLAKAIQYYFILNKKEEAKDILKFIIFFAAIWGIIW